MAVARERLEFHVQVWYAGFKKMFKNWRGCIKDKCQMMQVVEKMPFSEKPEELNLFCLS